MHEQIVEITEKLKKSLEELFDSETYKKYLKTMSKFHNYSWSNVLLISMQKPDATLVAGYTSWVKDFGRNVKKGEKGIRIIAPAPIKKKVQKDVIDDISNTVTKEEVEVIIPNFRVVTVFDYSQTEGKELPAIGVDELTGNVSNYQELIDALMKLSPVPVEFSDIVGGAKGFYSLVDKKIVLQKNMSEIQTTKTLIHEIAHALLHDRDRLQTEGDNDVKKTKNRKEIEAESVAFTVCEHLGISTSDYSFSYIAGYSKDKELKELKESMETIRKTASRIISGIEEIYKEKNLTIAETPEMGIQKKTVQGMESSR